MGLFAKGQELIHVSGRGYCQYRGRRRRQVRFRFYGEIGEHGRAHSGEKTQGQGTVTVTIDRLYLICTVSWIYSTRLTWPSYQFSKLNRMAAGDLGTEDELLTVTT